MIRSIATGVFSGALLLAALPQVACSQTNGYRVEPSGRATAVVTLNRPAPRGTPAADRPAPARVSIDYGQPHLRGRDVLTLIPDNQVWRLGANTSTSLTTDLDLVIGGANVPKGTYTLWLLRSGNSAKLIVNKQTGQWGTAYDASHDLVRVDMRAQRLQSPLESLQIALVPSTTGPQGVLSVSWGTASYAVDWAVKQ